MKENIENSIKPELLHCVICGKNGNETDLFAIFSPGDSLLGFVCHDDMLEAESLSPKELSKSLPIELD